MSSSLGNTIRSGTKWLFAGSVSTQALSFIFGIVLARLLVPADFGLLVTIQIFTGLVGYVSGGGMGQALVREKEVILKDYNIVFTLQIIIGVFIYLLFYAISPWFAVLFDNPLYESLLRLSAISFIIRPFVNLPHNKLYREERYQAKSIISILTLFVSSSVSIVMAVLGYGVWSLVWGGIIASLITAIVLMIISGWRPGLAWDLTRGKTLASYGYLVSANDIVLHLKNQTANFILARTIGPASVGLFNKADSLSQIPANLIGGATYQTVFRGLASIQDNIDKSSYVYFRSITLVLFYVAPMYIILFWVAKPFITFVYGENWSAAGEPLVILALSGIFSCMQQQAGAVIAARNGLKRELKIHIEAWLMLIVFCLLGADYGLLWVAYSVTLANFYSTMRHTSLALKMLNSSWSQYFNSIKPAIKLNLPLFILLLVINSVIPGDYIYSYPGAYTLVMAVLTVLALILLIVIMRVPEYVTETARWRQLFKQYINTKLFKN
jgi:O-antigen/teichoic acid export membrane protein